MQAILDNASSRQLQAASLPAGEFTAQEQLRTVRSEDLLQGLKTIAIRHNDAVYRLQTTKQGKLILTK